MKSFLNRSVLLGVMTTLLAATVAYGRSADASPSKQAASTTVATYARTYYSHAAASPSPVPGSSPVRVVVNPAPTPLPAPPPVVASTPAPAPTVQLVVSVPDQKLAVLVDGKIFKAYPISTSRYGEGDYWGSWRTPVGMLQIAGKIGGKAAPGAVFWRRQVTGEVLPANAPGRDPIVSRIIWLRGMEDENKNAYKRCIYIHGTPQEAFLGRKASFGCIRMRSVDVIQVFDWVNIGTPVAILQEPLRQAAKHMDNMTLVARNEPPSSIVRNEHLTAMARSVPPSMIARNESPANVAIPVNENHPASVTPLLKVGPPDPEVRASRKTAAN